MGKFFKCIISPLMFLLTMYAQDVCAAQVQFHLTTHVDGRTINGGATVNSYADLQSGLPAKLKRAYCTYSFYKDAALTQPLTEADFKNGDVYVDYVFNPPFNVSSEGDEWYYFLTTYESNHGFEWLEVVKTQMGAGMVGTYYQQGVSAPTISYINQGLFEWAFFGDPYYMQIKNRYSKDYMYADGTYVKRRSSPFNWQMYENSTTFSTPNGETHSTFSLTGNPDYGTGNYFISQNWNGNSLYTNGARFSGATVTSSQFAWFLTLGMHIGGNDAYKYVVYTVSNNTKTLRAQTDYIKYTSQFNTPDNFPQSLKIPGATYSFYKDANLSTEYPTVAKGAGMVVIYVKEEFSSQPFITDKWITLVLPYDVANLEEEFGKTADGSAPAVRVLEYTGVTSDENGSQFHLNFESRDHIVANKPYLFKADEVLESKSLTLSKGTPGVEANALDNAIRLSSSACPSTTVSMIGTFEGKTLTPQSETEHPGLLYFYIGQASDGKYNFYRVTKKEAQIASNRCYFQIEGNATSGAKFTALGVNGVITSVDGIQTEPDAFSGSIYNMNGQMVSKKGSTGLPKGLYIVNGKKVIVK